MNKVGFILVCQLRRECVLNLREYQQSLSVFLFFVLFLLIFPLSLSPETENLRSFAPGLSWMAMLFVFLLSSERLFLADYQQGLIEQWLCSGESLPLIVFGKVLFHTLFYLIPLLFLCPVIALFFSLTAYETLVLMISLSLGAPALAFLCALAAVFGIGARQSAVLVGLILFPLAVPLIIFGSGALLAAMQGLVVLPYFALLLAFSILAAALMPFAIAAVIKISLSD